MCWRALVAMQVEVGRQQEMDRPYRSYIEQNAAELARLKGLAGRLSDEELCRSLADGWTVAATLAHCAFWDRMALLRWQSWEREGMRYVPLELDVLNGALLPQWLAIPPREALRQAVRAAEEIDSKIEGLPPQLVEEYRTSDQAKWMLETWEHRREHLDEIEHVLSEC